ncbi:ATPase [Aureococcus anophagefferens]|nr:ATPase [Aureococcus anophagefferens]
MSAAGSPAGSPRQQNNSNTGGSPAGSPRQPSSPMETKWEKARADSPELFKRSLSLEEAAQRTASPWDEASGLAAELLAHAGADENRPEEDASLLRALGACFAPELADLGWWMALEYGCLFAQAALGAARESDVPDVKGSDLGHVIRVLHDKLLKASSAEVRRLGAGYVVSLVASDVMRFDAVSTFLWAPVLSVVAVAAVVAMVAAAVGPLAAIAGCFVVLASVAVQIRLGGELKHVRKRAAARTDARVRLVNELLGGVVAVKASCWERPFARVVGGLRKLEAVEIYASQRLKAVNSALFFSTTALAGLATFGVYYVFGPNVGRDEGLTVGAASTVVASLAVLRLIVGKHLARFTSLAPEAYVAVRRMEAFLKCRVVVHKSGWRRGGFALAETGDRRKPWGEVDRRKRGEGDFSDEINILVHLDHAAFVRPSEAARAEHSKIAATIENRTRSRRDTDDDLEMLEAELEHERLRETQNLYWTPESAAVSNLTLDVRRFEVLMLSGPVGCGKSSFLEALLGELDLVHGTATAKAGALVAYAPQTPTILAATLRENVLFGERFEERAYVDALRAADLELDVDQLPRGDQTLLGERGVNLSGGQMARVNLARAVYVARFACFHMKNAYGQPPPVVVLLDDVSSSWGPRTRVVYLNANGRSPDAHELYVGSQDHYPEASRRASEAQALEDALVLARGTYTCSGVACGPDGRVALDGDALEQISCGSGPGALRDYDDLAQVACVGQLSPASAYRTIRDVKIEIVTDVGLTDALEEAGDDDGSVDSHASKHEASDLVVAEDQRAGRVRTSTWRVYAGAAGAPAVAGVAVLFVVAQVALMAADYAVLRWAEADRDDQRETTHVASYGAATAVVVTASLVGAVAFFRSTSRASTRLHDGALQGSKRERNSQLQRLLSRPFSTRALAALFDAPLWFFHANPVGRILNRFSADVAQVDEQLAVALFDFAQYGLMMVGAVAAAVAAAPFVLAVAPAVYLAFRAVKAEVVTSMTVLKRLDGVCKSPVFSAFSGTLHGLVTTRAYPHAGKRAAEELDAALATSARAWYWWLICNRYLGFHLDFLCSLFLAAVVVLAVLLRRSVAPALLALALLYGVQLSGNFQYMIRQHALAETYMTSVERLAHYRDGLDSEVRDGPRSFNDDDDDPWPRTGAVVFETVSCRYRHDLPLVLSQVNVRLDAGSKVGVVGRTGSGKSSFLLAIPRLNEVSEGRVLVDGVDAASVPLHVLRRAMAIIPQEPTLFSGTTRFNLDPFDEASEDACYAALRKARLLTAKHDPLDVLRRPVGEGGGDWSVGERQLLCLARALLLKRRIVSIDEATANVDLDTDRVIQTTLKTAFPGSTVIVVAHRLQTVQDSDVLLVFSIARRGLDDSPAAPPAIAFRLSDGSRFTVEAGDEAAYARFVERPVLCEYAGGVDSDLASLATTNSARYLFRLWPQILNRLLYFTEVGVRNFLWIGELPPSLGRATSPECLASRSMRLFQSRQPRRRLGITASFYDGENRSPARNATGVDVSRVSNHMLKVPAALATLRHPTVAGVALLDLDAIAPVPWSAPDDLRAAHRGAFDVVFPSSKRLGPSFPCWRVKSSHFNARDAPFSLAFFSTWFANRCSFKDQYSLWHTLLSAAAAAGCVPYDGDIYESYEYWEAVYVEKRYGDGAYPAGLNLTCERIRRFCPTFPVDLGARACAPTGLLAAFHHHTVDAVRRFPLAGGADLVVVDPRIPGVDKRTRLSNRDFLARLGVLGRDDWPAV